MVVMVMFKSLQLLVRSILALESSHWQVEGDLIVFTAIVMPRIFFRFQEHKTNWFNCWFHLLFPLKVDVNRPKCWALSILLELGLACSLITEPDCVLWKVSVVWGGPLTEIFFRYSPVQDEVINCVCIFSNNIELETDWNQFFFFIDVFLFLSLDFFIIEFLCIFMIWLINIGRWLTGLIFFLIKCGITAIVLSGILSTFIILVTWWTTLCFSFFLILC